MTADARGALYKERCYVAMLKQEKPNQHIWGSNFRIKT